VEVFEKYALLARRAGTQKGAAFWFVAYFFFVLHFFFVVAKVAILTTRIWLKECNFRIQFTLLLYERCSIIALNLVGKRRNTKLLFFFNEEDMKKTVCIPDG
jgi:hypothetical protein